MQDDTMNRPAFGAPMENGTSRNHTLGRQRVERETPVLYGPATDSILFELCTRPLIENLAQRFTCA